LGCKKIEHLFSLSKCKHCNAAGLPNGCRGIAEEIDGAIQQAPQPIRHCINNLMCFWMFSGAKSARYYLKKFNPVN
jgi:hypothetical protein